MQVIIIDDIATTGISMLNGIKQLKEASISISEAFVIINRLDGADKTLNSVEVNLHQLTDILEITEILYKEKLVSEDVLNKIKNQIDQS
jgi:orotate phosphoribosyltransferase